jgi:hypothetical protein
MLNVELRGRTKDFTANGRELTLINKEVSLRRARRDMEKRRHKITGILSAFFSCLKNWLIGYFEIAWNLGTGIFLISC